MGDRSRCLWYFFLLYKCLHTCVALYNLLRKSKTLIKQWIHKSFFLKNICISFSILFFISTIFFDCAVLKGSYKYNCSNPSLTAVVLNILSAYFLSSAYGLLECVFQRVIMTDLFDFLLYDIECAVLRFISSVEWLHHISQIPLTW